MKELSAFRTLGCQLLERFFSWVSSLLYVGSIKPSAEMNGFDKSTGNQASSSVMPSASVNGKGSSCVDQYALRMHSGKI